MFSLFWVLYIVIPLAVGFGIEFQPEGALYILVFIVTFGLGSVGFRWEKAIAVHHGKEPQDRLISKKIIKLILFLFFIIAVVGHCVDLIIQGIDFSSGLLNIGGQYAAARYGEVLIANIYSQIALLASFQCAIFGGLIIAFFPNDRRKILTILMAFIPAVLVMILQSAKGLFFLSAAYFLGAFLAARILSGNLKIPKINFSKTVSIFTIVLLITTLSFIARGAGDDDLLSMSKQLRFSFSSYSAGHFFGFSDWFFDRYFEKSTINQYDQPEFVGGFYTFSSVFKILGDARELPLGTYVEYPDFGEFITSNIFTAFRGLISDFGIAGSFLFALFLGWIASMMYYLLLISKRSFIPAVFFIYFFGWIFQTYGVSNLMWVSILFSFFLTAFSLYFITLFRKS